MNIAIIGAGLVGRLLAWQLLEKGHSVSLFDKDSGGGESSAGLVAAAMLAPYSEIVDAEPAVYHQGLAGLSIWKKWSEQLKLATDIDIDLRLTGSLVVSHRNDMGDYQRFIQRMKAHRDLDQGAIHYLNQDDIYQLEPELSTNFERACYLEKEACLDNAALFQALQKRIKALGGLWHKGIHVETLTDAMISEHYQQYDQVIDCRGFGAKNDADDLRGVRGEVIRVKAPEVNLSRPVRLMHPRYKLYIAPKPNHEYVIGATQIESESEHAITVRSNLELMSALYSVHSGFSEAEILSQHARCRPAFSDNLPQITQHEKLIRINGLYRHGYLLSPSVITQAMALLNESKEVWPEIVEGERLVNLQASVS